jgi:hypothetical protein
MDRESDVAIAILCIAVVMCFATVALPFMFGR